MRTWNHSYVIGLLTAACLASGCSGSSASSAPAPSTTPSPAGITTPTLTPTVRPTPSSAATATVRPAASPMPGADLVGKTAVTAVDGVRVRSQPRVADDSYKAEPLLPRGTALYVLDGPVTASGYDWYNVAQLTSRTLPSGWVASAGRDGEPWIAAGDFACPPLPGDLAALMALPSGVGLACFSRVPITVTARLIGCNCDMDGSSYTPDWFFLGSGGPTLLVEPDVTRPPENPRDWFPLDLDPIGRHPDVLPIGKVVQLTGIFDHPAAASCTVTEMDAEPVPSQGCRLEFAVTRLVATGRPGEA